MLILEMHILKNKTAITKLRRTYTIFKIDYFKSCESFASHEKDKFH
jgi:hypothetical protein